MIRFNVFNKGKPAQTMSLNGTYLFGQDDIPVRSQVDFSTGELLGLRHSDTAVGLSTLWDINSFGKTILQTTRLPERNESYNLNVEIARGRLLHISQKREEWGLTDRALAENHHELIDESLDKFVDALCNLDQPEKASVLADESLLLSMKAGEQMSMTHAKVFFDRRNTTQKIGQHCFGCCFDPSRIKDSKYLSHIKKNFQFVTVPISWRQIEPKEHERNFDLIDECINWLGRNRIAVQVGPLLSFSPLAVPDWLYIWENDFEQVRDMAYEYITSVIKRYDKKVQAWNVVGGLNADNCFKFSFEQIIDMTRSAVLAARQVADRSLLLVEITKPWGEYYAQNQRTIPPMIYLDMICQSGVSFDALAVTLRFGRGGGGMQTRDLLELSSMLDRVGIFGKQLHLSNVQVPSLPDPRDNNSKLGEAGCWHGQWTEQTQADWLEQVYQIALSKPFVETITWQDLVDRPDGILQFGGLLRQDLTPKPVFTKLIQLKNKLIRQKT